MYIYNVTVNIDESVQSEWVKWMKETHIPEVLKTGKFTKALMSKVLIEEEMGGTTYSIQYTANSKEDIQKYYQEDAERLRNEVFLKFSNKFVAFRTELKVISQIFSQSN